MKKRTNFRLRLLPRLRYHNDVDDETYDPNAEYLTVAEAATSLTIKTQTLGTAITRGRMPCIRVHGRVLVTRAAVEEYRARSQPNGRPMHGRPKSRQNQAGSDGE